MMLTTGKGTRVRILPQLCNKSFSVNEGHFQTYMKARSGSVRDYYFKYVLDGTLVNLLESPKMLCKAYKEMK